MCKPILRLSEHKFYTDLALSLAFSDLVDSRNPAAISSRTRLGRPAFVRLRRGEGEFGRLALLAGGGN
jgi:hypothetical protein